MALCLLLGAPPTAQGVTAHPDVVEAQEALARARQRMADAQARLDTLATQFEDSRDHVARLEDELGDADERVATAQADATTSLADQRAAIRRAYMQPGIDHLRVPGAFLFAPDVETALHASAVMGRVAQGLTDQARRAVDARERVEADVASQQGITAGTTAALDDLQRLSATFGEALQATISDVAAAEDGLDLAIRTAEEDAWREQFQASLGAVPAPLIRIATVNGQRQEMTCPLGQPNGFVDTWHAPRSGGRLHKGVDMFAAYGMPLFAAADGTVTRVWNNALGGLSVDLYDRFGNRYYYAHLSAAYVVAGQQVRVGTLLGANGQSGNARFTPPHLHWQFHPGGGAPVNPFTLAAALCR